MKLYQGDCLEVIDKLIAEGVKVDAIITDPPYELGFMGKKWDNSGITYNVEFWKKCLRILRPGGHLLAFGGTRTYHRMAVVIEDAGFEIRDMLEWIYASGFPKSQNIGKAYDKKMGYKTKNSSPYEGLGTALKPAHEPIVMARKPLSEKTIVENIIKHGTGGLDIDSCRIPTEHSQGRFPANILCTDDALNDGKITKSGYMSPELHKRVATNKNDVMGVCYGKYNNKDRPLNETYGDSGSKSRYFDLDVWAEKHGLLQFSKASKKDKEEGNTHPTVKPTHLMAWLVRLVSKDSDTVLNPFIILDPFMGSGTTGVACKKLGRDFIGIELDEEYFKIAEQRINKACVNEAISR